MAYCVYILQCKDGSYYTGYTSNIEKRLRLHSKGKGARYTRIHKSTRVVYAENCETRSDAMRRERQIKSLSHYGKMRLCNPRKKPTK